MRVVYNSSNKNYNLKNNINFNTPLRVKKSSNVVTFRGKSSMEKVLHLFSNFDKALSIEKAKTLGKAVLTPLVILWNPFCKHDKKSQNERKGSAIVQPLEAGFEFLSYLVASILTSRFVESRIIKENKNIKMTAGKIVARLYNISDKHGEGCLKILKDRISTIVGVLMIFPVSLAVNWLTGLRLKKKSKKLIQGA